MNVIPSYNRLLVLMDEAETKSAGGIIIADLAKKESTFGKVIAIGDKKDEKFEPISYPAAPGQRVMVTKYGGVTINVHGQELKIFTCDDILAVIELSEQEQKELAEKLKK